MSIAATDPGATGLGDASTDASDADTARSTAGGGPSRRSSVVLITLFTLTTFLAATLLFLVQPMVTKMLLPSLGGTPAVWNTAMVFFQAVLLGGYAFAHVTLTRLGVRRQSVLQVVFLLLPLAALPIALPSGWRPPVEGSPMAWTLLVLAVMVGAPFFALSTASPTLQRWFSTSGHVRAHDPYFLYAAGNVGSLLALLAYPLVVEPLLSVDDQSQLWSWLYVAFVVLSAACAVLLRRLAPSVAPAPPAPAPIAPDEGADATGPADAGRPATERVVTARMRLRWIFLSAIPSALMLGVTRHISTDVASMPLLWVIPLALYLVTFIVAFGRSGGGPVAFSARALKLLVIPLTLSFFGLVGSIWVSLLLNLAVFFCVAMVAHGRLAAERPAPEKLTEFYLLLSTGGVVGGILTALVAPVVFTTVLEYPITIALALSILPASAFVPSRGAAGDDVPGRRWPPRPRTVLLGAAVLVLAALSVTIRSTGTQEALTASILVAAVVAVGAFVLARTARGLAATILVLFLVAFLVPANTTRYEERTFFGVHRVYEDKTNNRRHVLLNGTTVHGMEDYEGSTAGQPTTYYHPTGPIGQYFAAGEGAAPRRAGLIGLGSGALAAYGRPGDTFDYYEIDAAVIDIAEDPSLFDFVSSSAADTSFILGDGRLELEARPDERYDLLVIDAFTGDSIPAHLLTTEALSLYEQRLTDDGVLAFHISNRYFDFAPILGRLAAEHGLTAIIQDDPPSPDEEREGKLEATWVLLAADPAALEPMASDPRWVPLPGHPDAPLWTDSFSDLLHVFRW